MQTTNQSNQHSDVGLHAYSIFAKDNTFIGNNPYYSFFLLSSLIYNSYCSDEQDPRQAAVNVSVPLDSCHSWERVW